MEKVVDRFSNIVKDGLQKCGGLLIKHTGDSFLIYFDRGQPLLCAIAINRMVAQTMWGLPDPLSVRMVITTITNHRNSYPEYSPEFVSCRAVLYAASGNQILLTEQAARTLEFPVSSRAQNLGSYILPGQVNPTQIYMLVHPHLPNPEPDGLRSLVRAPSNLPLQSTRFVGREIELKQLSDLLAQP